MTDVIKAKTKTESKIIRYKKYYYLTIFSYCVVVSTKRNATNEKCSRTKVTFYSLKCVACLHQVYHVLYTPLYLLVYRTHVRVYHTFLYKNVRKVGNK